MQINNYIAEKWDNLLEISWRWSLKTPFFSPKVTEESNSIPGRNARVVMPHCCENTNLCGCGWNGDPWLLRSWMPQTTKLLSFDVGGGRKVRRSCALTLKSGERALDDDRLLWQLLKGLIELLKQAGVSTWWLNFLCKGHNRNQCRQVAYLILTCVPWRWWKNGRGIAAAALAPLSPPRLPPFHWAEQGARQPQSLQGLTFYKKPSLGSGFVHKVSCVYSGC